jgi:hypothetical protein
VDSELSTEVNCEEHGKADVTFVCAHLIADPVQRWHCARASTDNPWPDAWCDQCNEAYLREGEWNENNETCVDIEILCHHCYEQLLGKSVARLAGADLSAWHTFVKECHEELQIKQDTLRREYGLSRHKRWDWYQDRGELIFSNDGVPALVAKIEFVGSVSTASNTWLWSWADSSVSDTVRSRIAAVWDFGEERDFPHLMVPKWAAEEADGWDMAAVAAHVLDAAGIYRTPGDNGFTFILLMQMNFAQ